VRALLVLGLFLSAGCLGLADRDTDTTGGPVVGDAASFLHGGYVCPPGAETPIGGGVCTQRFVYPTEGLLEVDMAVSPRAATTMAFIANNGQGVGAAGSMTGSSPHVETQRFGLFVTNDGAATWKRMFLPDPPERTTPGAMVQDVNFFDPTIAFDLEGGLNVAGILTWTDAQGGSTIRQIFHVRSPDGGATWGTYSFFGDRVDHPWMRRAEDGALNLVFWEPGRDGNISLVRSVDNGTTWWELPPEKEFRCYTPSAPVSRGGNVYVLCDRDERIENPADMPASGVYRFDPALEAFVLLADLGVADAGSLLAPADGSLVMMAGDVRGGGDYEIMIQRSTDGGRTWTRLPDLLARVSVTDEWSFQRYMGGAGDPWGNLHVFMTGLAVPPRADVGPAGPYIDLPTFVAAAYADDFAVAHIVLDAKTGEVRSEQLLTPNVPHVPFSPAFGVGRVGDYFGLVFPDDHAVLVWEYERNLHLTFWEPRP
jgi:hypothetical protein